MRSAMPCIACTLALGLLCALPPSAEAQSEQDHLSKVFDTMAPAVQLGARLFHDNRLSNPGANLAANCRTCHAPPEATRGKRQYADVTPLSVIPANAFGGKQETIRNAPTLLDALAQAHFNADGQFESLEALLKHKLTSTHMGWLPDQEEQVKDELFALLLNDQGEDPTARGTYLEQFEAVKGIDLLSVTADDAFDLIIASLIEYLETIQTHNTAPWDALAFLNRFNEGLAGEDDTPQDLSGRIFGRIANQEGRVLIRFPNIYNEDAYQGMKTFMRIEPTWSSSVEGMEENVGNCIACHIPPKFTDGKFHNIGVTQLQYDAAHGEGAFTVLEFETPSPTTRARVDPNDPSKADLGRWNIDPRDDTFAAFKTPPLRNTSGTDPYMHNGQYATVQDAIRLHIIASEMAKAGGLRNPDPQLLIMNITEEDIPDLTAFIATLEEVPEDEFRDFRVDNVRIRQDPLGEQTYNN